MFALYLTEKQEELLGIHKRFKAEVEQHLQECGSLIEDLEEHEIELKRSVEKQSMNIQSQRTLFHNVLFEPIRTWHAGSWLIFPFYKKPSNIILDELKHIRLQFLTLNQQT